MIEIENEIFNDLTDKLKEKFSDIATSSTYTNTPPSYPFVSIEQIEDSVDINHEDSCHIDYATNVGFEINVYSKDASGRKSQAKEIVKVVDDYMIGLGLYRQTKTPMQDNNETIFRYVLRYNGKVNYKKVIFRR